MSDGWMYRDFGQDFGPVPYAQLQSLAVAGTISPDCEVRCINETTWKKAGNVAGLEFPNLARAGRSTGSDPNLSVKGADDWYYNVGGLELGPVTFDELLELGRSEQLSADDNIRLGVNGKWRRAGSIGRLMAVLPFQVLEKNRPTDRPLSNVGIDSVGASSPALQAPLPATTANQETKKSNHAGYEQAYEQAKESIAGLIVAQAEAAFKTAEAQANQEISWAFAPGLDSQWWGWMGSVEYGPVGFQQVFALARNGQIKPTDFVRNGLLGQYVPAGTLPGLFSAVAIVSKANEALVFAKAQAKAAVELATPSLPQPATNANRRQQTPAREFAAVQATPKSDPSLKTVAPKQSAKPASQTPAKEIAQRDIAQPALAVAKSNAAVLAAPQAAPAVAAGSDTLELVREALASRSIPGLNRIELEFSNGELVMRGNLGTEGERLLALRVAGQIAGVAKVIDSLTVTQASRITPAKSSPVMAARPAQRSSGPGALTRLIDSVRTLNPKYGVSAVAVTGLLGFGLWSFAGNSRPVAVHPVKGRVILNGEPIANASIVLHRVGHSNVPVNLHPRGRAKDDGSFALETFDPGDGAPNGEFVATVCLNKIIEADGETLPGPNVLPAVYSRPDTSPLKIKITSTTRELQPLELTDKEKE